MIGWPDPDNPGVPLTPERDGRHWLFDPVSSKSYPENWVAEIGAWAVGDAWTPRIVAEMGLHYQGPVLTPAKADALRAENARLREALVYIGDVCIRHDQGNETGRVLGHIADNARAALEAKP